MALAERLLAAEFNRPGHAIVDHRTYVFVGDGCPMEASARGVFARRDAGLSKLTAFYDDNGISIDGEKRAGSPTTRRAASRPTAGTSCPASTGTTSMRSTRRSARRTR
jgi:transketolase